MSMGETSFTRATKFTACSLRLFFSGENVVHRLSEKYSADYLQNRKCVCVCVKGDLELYCARSVLEQSDSL